MGESGSGVVESEDVDSIDPSEDELDVDLEDDLDELTDILDKLDEDEKA